MALVSAIPWNPPPPPPQELQIPALPNFLAGVHPQQHRPPLLRLYLRHDASRWRAVTRHPRTSIEKISVARQLACIGVDLIEAGFPLSSPDDLEAVRSTAMEMGNKAGEDGHVPVICGLARCNKWNIDEAWKAVRHARRPRVHTFIATSEIHLQHKLRKTREEVVMIARKMFAYARSLGFHNIEFSPEDAGREDAKQVLVF